MTQTFKTSAMTCGGCARNIKAVLTRQPGVKTVDADPATKLVTVDFDEHQTPPGKIAATLAAAGYPVDV